MNCKHQDKNGESTLRFTNKRKSKLFIYECLKCGKELGLESVEDHLKRIEEAERKAKEELEPEIKKENPKKRIYRRIK